MASFDDLSDTESSSTVSSECSTVSSASSSGLSNLSESDASYRVLNYVFTTGERRTSNVIYTLDEHQYYCFNGHNRTAKAYKCKSCNSRVHLRNDNTLIQKKRYYKHTHEQESVLFDKLVILNEIKRKCADISTLIAERKQSVRDVFYSVVTKHPEANGKLIFEDYERTLSTIRSSAFPKNPINTADISNIFKRDDVMNLIGKSKTGSIFYDGVIEGDGYAACFFSSKATLELFELNERPGERIIMIDGTFDVVPVGAFQQLLILYAVYMEKV